LTGVAVKVTLVSLVTGLADATIDTLTGRIGLMVTADGAEVISHPVMPSVTLTL